jgi:hypothetical protein
MSVFSKYRHLGFMILLFGFAVAKADMGASESISPKVASAMYTEKKAVIVDARLFSVLNTRIFPNYLPHIRNGSSGER